MRNWQRDEMRKMTEAALWLPKVRALTCLLAALVLACAAAGEVSRDTHIYIFQNLR